MQTSKEEDSHLLSRERKLAGKGRASSQKLRFCKVHREDRTAVLFERAGVAPYADTKCLVDVVGPALHDATVVRVCCR